jgi:glycerophosphoryl diester phosphodiesterase
MRTHAPTLCVGYIVEAAERAAEALERAEGDALALVDFDARLLLADPTLAAKAHARGIAMAAWTVDDPCDATRLLEVGVPRITTNQVGSLLAWKASL